MKTRKLMLATAATIAAVSICAMFSQPASAQSYAGPGPAPVFTDNFQTGNDTVNTATGPGGTPTASYTSYNMNYDKGTGFTDTISPGDLNMNFPSSSSMFGEAQAVFSSSPVTLSAVGDYIDFILEFTDTANILGSSGGVANELNMGLYDDGGIEPLPGNVATMTAQTGGTQGWTGYYSQILNANGGTSSKLWYRPSQISNTGSGTETLAVNTGTISGGFGNTGTPSYQAVQLINASKASTVIMTNGVQYTEDFRITLASPGVLSVSNEVFTGLGTGGVLDYQFGGYTNATDMSFDGLAFLVGNKNTVVMTQDVSEIEITTNIPEPSTWMLIAASLPVLLAVVSRRRRS